MHALTLIANGNIMDMDQPEGEDYLEEEAHSMMVYLDVRGLLRRLLPALLPRILRACRWLLLRAQRTRRQRRPHTPPRLRM